MARSRRRETHRTSVVSDGGVTRAQLVVALEEIEGDEGAPATMRSLRNWFPRLVEWPAALAPAGRGASIVFDGFQLTLHATGDHDGVEFTGTHDGDVFADAAGVSAVEVVIVEGLNPRRARSDELGDAARSGRLVGAMVPAYRVDLL